MPRKEHHPMRTLIRTVTDIPWMPQLHEGRLYITDELPARETCGSAFGFVFQGEDVLLTRLYERDWDIPGGVIDSGETPAAAAIREVWEETAARVEIIELIGIQELEILGPRPAGHRWPYPISVQVYYLCRLIELCPFVANSESSERGFIAPKIARRTPTMVNHDLIYEEALRRIQMR
jgi:8-oxo-dGTP diphosphatase